MQEVADVVYVILLDQVVAQARLRWSAEAAAGVKEMSDPAEAVDEFERRLGAPLDVEQTRTRMLEWAGTG